MTTPSGTCGKCKKIYHGWALLQQGQDKCDCGGKVVSIPQPQDEGLVCPFCGAENNGEPHPTYVKQSEGTFYGIQAHLVGIGWKCADCGKTWGTEDLPEGVDEHEAEPMFDTRAEDRGER